jgi:glycosyltransferase involved in cell wall biosynthesis
MTDNKSYQWKVCVKCYTYNQSIYIIDAMNGFTMQQTDFPFVCCIVDDCSTDGEQEVIMNYLQDNFDLEDESVVRNEETEDYVLCFAQHKTNQNCYFAVFYLKYNHYSIKKTKAPYFKEWKNDTKYLAICEGDDYWIDKQKLQIQVDFLDAHPNINMCTHACQIVRDDKKVISVMKVKGGDHILDTGKLIEGVGAGRTVTLVYRPRLYDNRPSFWSKLRVGDYPLCIWHIKSCSPPV